MGHKCEGLPIIIKCPRNITVNYLPRVNIMQMAFKLKANRSLDKELYV